MRTTVDRFADVTIADDEIESLKGCSFRVKTNIPLKEFVIGDTPIEIGNFLSKVLVSWDGFDMELTHENIMELTLGEISLVTRLASEAIKNPR